LLYGKAQETDDAGAVRGVSRVLARGGDDCDSRGPYPYVTVGNRKMIDPQHADACWPASTITMLRQEAAEEW
jgi:hypothetical protein